LVLTADDLIVSRGVEAKAPRDNVLIELGLFIGRIGRQRTFLLAPREKNIKIPADLEGVVFATFATPPDPRRMLSAVGPACTEIRGAIKEQSVVGCDS
jgi:predicted nucleotide-binding protein